MNRFCNKIIHFDQKKSNSYNLILVIIKYLTKIMYYKVVKINTNAFKLAKVILIIVI